MSLGPNHLRHIDSNHKLIPRRFVILHMIALMATQHSRAVYLPKVLHRQQSRDCSPILWARSARVFNIKESAKDSNNSVNSAEANGKLRKDKAKSTLVCSSSLLWHISNAIRSETLKTIQILSTVLLREVKNSWTSWAVSASAILEIFSQRKSYILCVCQQILYSKKAADSPALEELIDNLEWWFFSRLAISQSRTSITKTRRVICIDLFQIVIYNILVYTCSMFLFSHGDF